MDHKQIMRAIMNTDMQYAVIGMVDGQPEVCAMATWLFIAQAASDSVAGSRVYDIEAQAFIAR